ncbi:hypothetical protein GCM10023346_16940 [Arthrobacter gyeryongensis]|uniref:AI-2E family transporter n=1 Tax=Arthrobacter gyeryongensis TaxID=1650592 RepID=A0ABP9SB78_9MICC
MQTPHVFAQVRNRLLIIGVIVCAGGVIFETLATNLLSLLFSLQGGAGGRVGLWLTGFIGSVVRFGLAPLGASLVALGIAAHILRNQIPDLLYNHAKDQ